MSLNIKAFQVLNGDCFLISFFSLHRNEESYILIDSGFASTYHRTLKLSMQQIADEGKRMDLVVITHFDNDHISGFIPFFKDFGVRNVQKIWFNHAGAEFSFPNNDGNIGAREGIQIRDFLLKTEKLSKNLIYFPQTHLIDNVTIRVLSPNLEDLQSYINKWQDTESDYKSDIQSIGSVKSDKHKTVSELLSDLQTTDRSISNRSSIAFLLDHDKRTILFTADSNPDVLAKSLISIGFSCEFPIKVDLMQVSHHGSKSNTSLDLLHLIDCNNYLVSTNASNSHQFPHKRALALIANTVNERRPNETINFYFTYDDPIFRDLFTSDEVSKYNIVCKFPPNCDNGINITI
ncbi:ComEC/Rec2 family competence protein [Dyadobacter sp. 3J3]|uniref:ComEC/Rec2 family competence protein n=1 Tax=Dyadobacter sp. 3J3 TaxID=2606600 RepID=UPI00135C31E1|nr:MBL fold metallo-hydrolase [Dyadobacter sp. 3J3]